MTDGTGERRVFHRISLNARIRVRPAGSSGIGHPCRVNDSSARGVRLTVDGRIDEDCEVLEVLSESGRRHENGIDMRVVWIDEHEDGGQRIGCVFENS